MREDWRNKCDGIGLALLLGLAFLCLSYLRIWGDMGSARFSGKVLDSVLSEPLLGTALGGHVIRFAVTQVLVYVGFGLLAWLLAILSQVAWPRVSASRRALILLWFLALTVWVLIANAFWFPGSSLGQPYSDAVRFAIAGVSVFSLSSALLLAGMIGICVASAVRIYKSATNPRLFWGAGVALLACSAAIPALEVFGGSPQSISPSRPNIILIGLDSLRADYVESARHDVTPMLDAFLPDTARFTDTVTPLARTFPAWVSILTGRNPHSTGAFVNLLPREQIQVDETLPAILRRNGYRTVFAMDETRFANIDLTYGFDQLVSPPMGASDFLLEFFSDAPVSNLLVNTRLGGALYPYAHANRAASRTYDPDSFVDRVSREVQFDEPTFLAVHLCLVHWPYAWADSADVGDGRDAESATRLYEQALRRVDRQFGDLLGQLERKGALENAIVVVLSDHGESLGELSPLAYDDGTIERVLGTRPEIFGHGTHVFSLEQSRVLLALQAYGDAPPEVMPGQRIASPASLEDIAPTILAALGIESAADFEGRDLLPLLEGAVDGEAESDARIRFLETEFNPAGLMEGQVASTSAVAEAVSNYRVDPVTDRVTMRAEYTDELLRNRQYAAISGERMLASIPAADDRAQHLIYIPGRSAEWRSIDTAGAAASDPATADLWAELGNRFGQVASRPVTPLPHERH